MPETPVPPFPSAGAVQPGQVLAGRYALTHLLARGGMADVWQSRDTLLERDVAVKILHPHLAADADFVARFRVEAVAAARLHHPSIVAIFDTCSEHGVEAIVMELVRGHTLREELDTHGPMDPPVTVNLGADVADALQAAHRAGLVHRDVKPANILLCDDQRVMITDFGIAKIRDAADRTEAGTMLGSAKYLSPEQVEGTAVDPRTDIYSLGIVLYEALTGKVPFDADTPAATALARLHTAPVRPRQVRPAIPVVLDEVVMKALERDPARRFSSAAELQAALLATRAVPAHVDPDITAIQPRPPGSAEPARPATPKSAPAREPAPPTRPRRRWGAAITAMVFIAAAIGVAAFLVAKTNSGRDVVGQIAPNDGTAVKAGPLKIAGIVSLDPDGDNSENDQQLARAFDGDPATFWHTEYYTDRAFSSSPKKKGVGIVISVDRTAPLAKLTVSSPTQDWAARAYVRDAPAATLAEWGDPIDQKTGIAGDGTFDLKGTEGKAVLLWITDLGSGPPAASPPPNVNVQVTDITLDAA